MHIIKNLILTTCFLFLFTIVAAQPVQIEPPFWFAGLKNSELSILLSAKQIQSYDFSCNHKDIRILTIEKPQNENYLWVTLQLSETLQPGSLVFNLKKGKKTFSLNYEIKARPNYKPANFSAKDNMYLIMPDRFVNADKTNDYPKGMHEKFNSADSAYGRHGGDLLGVTNSLDYVNSLGFTSIWLNPVYENDQPYESYHGYAITDFYNVDKRLGGNSAYKQLIDSAHNKGVKVVKDVVFNHMGDKNPLFQNLIDSSWFHWHNGFVRTNYRAPLLLDPYADAAEKELFLTGWFDKHMPDINTDNPMVQKYLIQQTLWWLLEFGIDGLRIDTYTYPGLDFMNTWQNAILAEFPNLFIFAEVWDHGPGVQAFFNTGMQKGKGVKYLMDFQVCFSLIKAINEKNTWTEGASSLYYTLAQDYMYEDASKQVTFIDNHDLARALGIFNGDKNKLKVALTLLFSTRGIPCILYGTEQLMQGTANHDLIREMMRGGKNAEKDLEKYADGEIYQLIQTLNQLRKQHPAFDDSAVLTQFIPQNGIYIYARKNNTKGIVGIYNNSGVKQKVNLKEKQYFADVKNFGVVINTHSIKTDLVVGSNDLKEPFKLDNPVLSSNGEVELLPGQMILLLW
jgi:glycosidase